MRTALRSGRVAIAAGAFLAAACQGTVPNQVMTKPVPASAPAPQPRARDFWVFKSQQNRQLFVIDQHAIVTTRRDTATRADSVSSHTELSLYSADESGANIHGEVTAFTVRAGGAPAAVPVTIPFPLQFTAMFSAHDRQVVFDMTGYGECGTPSFVAIQSIRDLTFHLPDTLRIGTTWQDSSAYLICRDGIPMNATVRRTFRVTGTAQENSRTLLLVSRSSHTELGGNGFPFGELAIVTGMGNGALVYKIDPASGEIISALGSATLDLVEHNEAGGKARTQAAHQVAEIRIGRS
jgi:hypothetical protein